MTNEQKNQKNEEIRPKIFDELNESIEQNEKEKSTYLKYAIWSFIGFSLPMIKINFWLGVSLSSFIALYYFFIKYREAEYLGKSLTQQKNTASLFEANPMLATMFTGEHKHTHPPTDTTPTGNVSAPELTGSGAYL